MESAIIVSCSEKGLDFIKEMLLCVSCNTIVSAATCGEARRLLLERDFDVCMINAPLPDESGERLARHVAAKGMGQVILIVSAVYYEEVSGAVEDYGIITLSKPINKSLFWSALKIAKAAQNRLEAMKAENNKLIRKIEDIRVVDRAKCILISYLNMSEPEAHKYIEKQAMDMRVTKKAIAEGILKTYEN